MPVHVRLRSIDIAVLGFYRGEHAVVGHVCICGVIKMPISISDAEFGGNYSCSWLLG